MNQNNYYSSSDLAMVTTLSLWYPIETIEKSDPHKAVFLFKKHQNLDKLVEEFWRGEVRVEPKTFFSQLKVIKSRLYSE